MGAKARPRRAQPARQSIRTVYRPSAALRSVALGLMLLLGVAALGFAYVSTRSLVSTAFCALPIGLFFLVALSYLSYLARRTSLVLSAEGLEYHTPNLSLRTSWDNVAQLVDDPLTPRLVLREPAPVESHTPAVRRAEASGGGRAIPLRMFGYTRSSALGRDLARRAPHLFQSAERSPT
jgi:hypothetical protein